MLYDGSAVSGTSGTPQHVSVSTARGNPTTISSLVAGSTTLSRTLTYFDTGNVQTVKDVNNAQTNALATFAYTACGNSFATGVTLTGTGLPTSPALSTSATWDANCYGAVQLTATDANGQTTTTNYADSNFWRPTSVVDPTRATTSIAYATNPVASESTLNFNGTTSTADTLATLDGLGRIHVSQRKQSQTSASYDSVETDYDALGRPSKVTVPYSASAGQPAPTNPATPATATTYDALNRPLLVTDGGGGTTAYLYNQNDVVVTVGPKPANDNSTKQRQLEYDALGRLTSVCEISGASGSGSCGQSTSKTGFWTKYA